LPGDVGPQGPAGPGAGASNSIITIAEGMNASNSNQVVYQDLPTTGPVIPITTTTANAKALVMLTCEMGTSNDNLIGRMSFEITGSDGSVIIVPADSRSVAGSLKSSSSNRIRLSAISLVTLGPAGSYTVKAKYRLQHSTVNGSEILTFSNREIVVTVF
jgi:hypothetical protein